MEAQLVGSDQLKEGWLVKEAVGKLGMSANWKDRYFILRNNALYYYDTKPKSYDKPKGIIEINAKTIVRPAAVQKKFAFEVCTGQIILRVRANNQMESNQWMAVIRDAVDVLKEQGGAREQKFEGYLTKRAMGTGRNWKRRWFVLKGGRLAYFEDRPTPGANDKPKGVMEFTADTTIQVYKEQQSVKPYTFEVTCKKLVLTASCDTLEGMNEWVDAIDLQILAKAGLTLPGQLEIAKWLRVIGLQEYARSMVNNDWDELATIYDCTPAQITDMINNLEMSRMEKDAMEEAVRLLKKGKRPKTHKELKKKEEPKAAPVLFNFDPPTGPKTNRLYTWGNSSDGRLGLVEARTGANCHTPQWVDALKGKSEVNAISCGTAAMGAITKDLGNVFTWGTGPLGLGNNKISSTRPFMVQSLKVPVKQLCCGESHMACLSRDGDVYAWGAGDAGQLGLGDKVMGCGDPVCLPVVGVQNKNAIVSLSCGPEQTMMVTHTGFVFVCGNNKNGQLGLPNEKNGFPEYTTIFTPTRVKALEGHPIGQCAVTSRFAVCVSKTGSAAFWFGKIGKSKEITPPERIPKFTTRPISFCVASRSTALFLVGLSMNLATKEYSSDSSVYSFGCDAHLLGHELSPQDMDESKPSLIEELEGHGVIQLAMSETHAGVVTQDGRILMWGQDTSGQLGSSYMVSIKRPSQCIDISGFKYTSLMVGDSFSAALCTEDDSKLIDGIPKGNPGPPPPPTDEALEAAQQEEDDLQVMLHKLNAFNTKFDLINAEAPPPPEEEDAPPPPPEEDEPPPPPEDEDFPAPPSPPKVTGGKRFLPPGSTDLGNGWIMHVDKVSGKKYYENPSTGVVQWSAPKL